MNFRDKEGIARAVKALSIVDKIQEFCEDNDYSFEEFLPIVRNPLRPENVAALGKFCTHCRGWPSRSTWYYVEVILKSFEVRDIRVHNKGEELDE